ncbi:MAG: hypothetical protein ACKOTB_17045 [Planctomycetia bacterium]
MTEAVKVLPATPAMLEAVGSGEKSARAKKARISRDSRVIPAGSPGRRACRISPQWPWMALRA